MKNKNINIIDICGSLVDHCGDVKKGLQYYGHAFIGKSGLFVGIADDLNCDGSYFIYGKQKDDELIVTRCIICGNPNVLIENTAKRVDNTNGFVGQSILKFHGNNHDLGNCKFVAIPADKTRELRTEEIYRLWDDVAYRASLISSFQREAYENFVQAEKKKNSKRNIQKVYRSK